MCGLLLNEDECVAPWMAGTEQPKPQSVEPEFYAPATDCFIGHLNAAKCEEIFNIAEAQTEAMIELNGVLDYFGRETAPVIQTFGRFHPDTLPNRRLT